MSSTGIRAKPKHLDSLRVRESFDSVQIHEINGLDSKSKAIRGPDRMFGKGTNCPLPSGNGCFPSRWALIYIATRNGADVVEVTFFSSSVYRDFTLMAFLVPGELFKFFNLDPTGMIGSGKD